MHSLTIQLFGDAATGFQLRCYDDATGNGSLPIAQHPLPTDSLNAIIAATQAHYRSTAPALDRLGKELYDWLDQATQRTLSQLRGTARHLALHLDCDARLGELPWELLHDADGYLCAAPHRLFTPVRRAASFPSSPRDPKNRYLRILFMAASPVDVQPVLNFEAEEGRILAATRQPDIDLVVEESGTLVGLRGVIGDHEEQHFDIVHISGHAEVKDGRAYFYLEDEYGNSEKAAAAAIAGVFGGRMPRLLFLSGCSTGAVPMRDMPSLCEALVAAGMPAVLGWALPVGDAAASDAARLLYEQIATGHRLDEAVAWTRQKLCEAKSPYGHLLRLYSDGAPLAPLVTPRQSAGRKEYIVKPAAQAFLGADERTRVCDRRSFIGRRRLLQVALGALRATPDQPEYTPGLLLHGTGGLGKSSLAARLCDRLSPSHRHLVWDGRIDETEILRRLTQHVQGADVLQEQVTAPDVVALLEDIRIPFTHRLERLFVGHLKHNLLLVFDDFEQNAQTAQTAQTAPDARTEAGPLRRRLLPMTDAAGKLTLEFQAETALRAVLGAVSRSGAQTRVLLTCRQVLANFQLTPLALSSLHDAELSKKIDSLPAFASASKVEPALRAQALAAAAGNPRLLEWLDKVLLAGGTDSAALLSRIEQTTAQFREDALLEGLLDQLPSDVRRTLALLNLYHLPVPQAALGALDETPDLPVRLRRLVALGLAETIADRGATTPARYYASPLLAPLLTEELDAASRHLAIGAAARVLHRLWRKEQASMSEAQALEIRRLAQDGGDQVLAASVTDVIAADAVNQHRYREAKHWCEETLRHGDDYRLLHTLARAEEVLGEGDAGAHYASALASAMKAADNTRDGQQELSALQNNFAGHLMLQGDIARALQLWEESLVIREEIGEMQGKAATLHNMAMVIAQQGDIARALQLWEESLAIEEKIGNIRGKAATLHNMAWVIAQQGDSPRALRLWEESLAIEVEIGDVRGRAATLHQMAGVFAEQGDIARALRLWEASLAIKEKIGDVHGKAATLANMAWAAWKAGDSARAAALNRDALAAVVLVRAWNDAITVLHNLSALVEPDEARSCLAQAAWLAVNIQAAPENTLNVFARLQQARGGPEAAQAPLIGAAAVVLIAMRASHHHNFEALRTRAEALLLASAGARGIAPEQADSWLREQGLLDPDRTLPAFVTELEKLVITWHFDRMLLA